MKKRIEYKIEDNDLDKVSGGELNFPGFFRPQKQYLNPYPCQRCGYIMGEREDIKDGDRCIECNYAQDIKAVERGEIRII